LARTTVLSSSNAGALVSFSAGAKDVFVTLPAALAYPTYTQTSSIDFGSSNIGVQTFDIAFPGAVTTHAVFASQAVSSDESELDALVLTGYIPSDNVVRVTARPVEGVVSGVFNVNIILR